MSKVHIGVFAHPNKRIYWTKKYEANDFYQSVYDLLKTWQEEGISYVPMQRWVHRVLYEPCPACTVKREGRMIKNMNVLDRVMHCSPYTVCKRPSYCLDCLGNWRYKNAKVIMEMHDRNPNLRLLLRRENILVPRGVCYADRTHENITLTAGRQINPVYDLPSGKVDSQSQNRRIIENDSKNLYKLDRGKVTNTYEDSTSTFWKSIGGSDVMEHDSMLWVYEHCKTPEQKAEMEAKMKEVHDIIHSNVRRGVSNLEQNPLIPELLTHASIISRTLSYSPGYLHRIIMVPFRQNPCVVLLRLDSLFLGEKEVYDRVKRKGGLWESNTHYHRIPLHNNPASPWYFEQKVTTCCRYIPEDIHKLLEIMESRFPYTGNRYTGFLLEEFLFYMNCLSQYDTIRCSGVFRGLTGG